MDSDALDEEADVDPVSADEGRRQDPMAASNGEDGRLLWYFSAGLATVALLVALVLVATTFFQFGRSGGIDDHGGNGEFATGNENDKARADFSDAVKSDPDDAEEHPKRGDAYLHNVASSPESVGRFPVVAV